MYIGMLFGALSCTPERFRPATGDLLFQITPSSPMSDAITDATARKNLPGYTHVAIAIRHENADSVIEATSKGGVRIVALDEFLKGSARIDGAPAVAVMRLRDTSGIASDAVTRARSHLGAPYDYSFLPDNGKFYCSELVWESFRREGRRIFSARPMNFRAPDGTLPAFWVELFAKQGEAVPEGVPGTNPDELSRDPQLQEVHRYF